MLALIKLLHTLVWAFMVCCILGVYVAAQAGRFGWALLCAAIVLAEVVVLVANRMRCPLTPLAARYTTDRRPNFDIYLPRWLAEHNQLVFGTLYSGGLAWALLLWWRAGMPPPWGGPT